MPRIPTTSPGQSTTNELDHGDDPDAAASERRGSRQPHGDGTVGLTGLPSIEEEEEAEEEAGYHSRRYARTGAAAAAAAAASPLRSGAVVRRTVPSPIPPSSPLAACFTAPARVNAAAEGAKRRKSSASSRSSAASSSRSSRSSGSSLFPWPEESLSGSPTASASGSGSPYDSGASQPPSLSRSRSHHRLSSSNSSSGSRRRAAVDVDTSYRGSAASGDGRQRRRPGQRRPLVGGSFVFGRQGELAPAAALSDDELRQLLRSTNSPSGLQTPASAGSFFLPTSLSLPQQSPLMPMGPPGGSLGSRFHQSRDEAMPHAGPSLEGKRLAFSLDEIRPPAHAPPADDVADLARKSSKRRASDGGGLSPAQTERLVRRRGSFSGTDEGGGAGRDSHMSSPPKKLTRSEVHSKPSRSPNIASRSPAFRGTPEGSLLPQVLESVKPPPPPPDERDRSKPVHSPQGRRNAVFVSPDSAQKNLLPPALDAPSARAGAPVESSAYRRRETSLSTVDESTMDDDHALGDRSDTARQQQQSGQSGFHTTHAGVGMARHNTRRPAPVFPRESSAPSSLTTRGHEKQSRSSSPSVTREFSNLSLSSSPTSKPHHSSASRQPSHSRSSPSVSVSSAGARPTSSSHTRYPGFPSIRTALPHQASRSHPAAAASWLMPPAHVDKFTQAQIDAARFMQTFVTSPGGAGAASPSQSFPAMQDGAGAGADSSLPRSISDHSPRSRHRFEQKLSAGALAGEAAQPLPRPGPGPAAPSDAHHRHGHAHREASSSSSGPSGPRLPPPSVSSSSSASASSASVSSASSSRARHGGHRRLGRARARSVIGAGGRHEMGASSRSESPLAPRSSSSPPSSYPAHSSARASYASLDSFTASSIHAATGQSIPVSPRAVKPEGSPLSRLLEHSGMQPLDAAAAQEARELTAFDFRMPSLFDSAEAAAASSLVPVESLGTKKKRLQNSKTKKRSPRNPKKLYRCQVPRCDKVFDRQSRLKTHMLSHSAEKPWACDQCHKRYRYSWGLKRHQTQQHAATTSESDSDHGGEGDGDESTPHSTTGSGARKWSSPSLPQHLGADAGTGGSTSPSSGAEMYSTPGAHSGTLLSPLTHQPRRDPPGGGGGTYPSLFPYDSS